MSSVKARKMYKTPAKKKGLTSGKVSPSKNIQILKENA